MSNLIGARNRQMANVRQDHLQHCNRPCQCGSQSHSTRLQQLLANRGEISKRDADIEKCTVRIATMTEGQLEHLTQISSNNKVKVVKVLICPDAEKLGDEVVKPQP